eukprot:3211071-Rhodomonas_salina.3
MLSEHARVSPMRTTTCSPASLSAPTSPVVAASRAFQGPQRYLAQASRGRPRHLRVMTTTRRERDRQTRSAEGRGRKWRKTRRAAGWWWAARRFQAACASTRRRVRAEPGAVRGCTGKRLEAVARGREWGRPEAGSWQDAAERASSAQLRALEILKFARAAARESSVHTQSVSCRFGAEGVDRTRFCDPRCEN